MVLGRVAMKLRMIVLLSLPVLFLGCAPGRLGGRPPDAPIAAEPAPDPAPSPATVPSPAPQAARIDRSEEHTSELQSLAYLVCRLLLEKKKKTYSPLCVR